ncbi:MAG: glycoside hydrolase family 43 protein [Opitutaceae bacterium]|jgi:alpha-N-arabinofuranosidase|nr:glycoside hydrolase family 43 protein [Opitutaceae bacterium]
MTIIRNPIIPGFNPDPSICRVGDDYYLAVSSFEYFPGVPLYHSRDLVNWRPAGHCLTRRSQLDLTGSAPSAGIYAPTLRHHDGTFYMVTTNVGKNGNFLVSAITAAGPWSDPVPLAQKGIDPSLLFDDDGRVYLTTSQNQQSEIDITTGRLLCEPRRTWAGTGGNDLEAPHLYKIGGWYYLLCAEGGTHHGHMVTIARAKSPWGPFEACPHNPILTNRHLPGHPVQAAGHADLFQAHDGGWWLVCLAIRPHGKSRFPKVHGLGRETFLAPVAWTPDGWPVVNGTGTLGLEVAAPAPPRRPWPPAPARDDFDAPMLAFHWQHLRNPHPEYYSLTRRPGWLALACGAETLDEPASPACVLRRQTEYVFRMETLLDFIPAREGGEAGMTVFMNNNHHYDFFVAGGAGGRRLALRLRVGDMTVERGSLPLPGDAPVRLRIESVSDSYRFLLAGDGNAGSEVLLGTAQSRYLGTEVAGGFTGVMIGLYATRRGQGAGPSTAAFFDWVEVEAKN